LHEQNLLQGRQ
jgi:hypothetical protein